VHSRMSPTQQSNRVVMRSEGLLQAGQPQGLPAPLPQAPGLLYLLPVVS
jgi:hypothetical protein